MKARKELLQGLLQLKDAQQLNGISEALSTYEWDWDDKPLVMLTEDMILSILQRYLSDELSEKQVEDWAFAIEDRDDVSIGDEDGDNRIIFFALAELANPATEGDLTPETAQELVKKLGSK